MRSTFFALALAAVGAAASAVRAAAPSAAPGCVSKCWANSQYVSTCAGNHKCLCDDADFQNAMYQCLYSQCQTAQFGTALHHALGLCQDEQAAVSSSVPALLRQGDLRKRQGFVSQSVSASAYPTRTVSRASQSVSASNYQTYSSSRALSTTLSTASSSKVSSASSTMTLSVSSSKVSSVSSSKASSTSSKASSTSSKASSATITATAKVAARYTGSYLEGRADVPLGHW